MFVPLLQPSWRHLAHLGNESMIAYRASDIQHSWHQPHLPKTQNKSHTCGFIKEGPGWDEDSAEDVEEEKSGPSRTKRDADRDESITSKTRCPLLLVADYRFFTEMGARNTKTTINYLVRNLSCTFYLLKVA